MWTRIELKQNAKKILKTSYWPALLVSVITLLLTGMGGGIGQRFDAKETQSFKGMNLDWANLLGNFWVQLILASVGLAILVGIFFRIFVSSTILVGEKRWFSRNREAQSTPSIAQMFSLFRGENWLRTVCAMLWMGFWLWLWTLLPMIPVIAGIVAIALYLVFVQPIILPAGWDFSQFPRDWQWNAQNGPFRNFEATAPQFFTDNQNTILLILAVLAAVILLGGLLSIPALIKSYAYRMTPWILGDNPKIGFRRALKLSKQMMRGSKFNLFVLDLSFVGWYLLGLIAFVIGTWFVRPYHQATVAELYAVLRKNTVNQGLATMEEFGFRAVAAEETLA